MPFYKLICSRCGAAFEQQASVSERTEKRIHCPSCGSNELQPDYSSGSASVHIAKNEDSCGHENCSFRCGGCGCGGCGCGDGRR